jgi:amino acid adenylation domain-containing protein/non-ribosomal peptide synthase protein (TIGR01720 family)
MTARNIQDIYPLSPLQEGIVLHALLEPGAGVYVDQLVCELSAPGGVDAARFAEAWALLARRHAVLRSAISWEQRAQSVQVVLREAEIPLEVLDWRGEDAQAQERRLRGWLAEDRRRGFDLAAAPLLRLALVRRGEDEIWLLATYHHAILDAWSVGVLCRELGEAYAALGRGEAPAWGPAFPYRDYVAWLAARDGSGDEAFWRGRLAGIQGPTPLGFDRRPEPALAGEAGVEELVLDGTETEALRTAARALSVTLYTLVQGAWALLLSRAGGQEDVVFGVAMAGRPHDLPGVEAAVGLFINTVPARVRIRPDATVRDWLREVHGELAALRRYELTPLVRVQGWSGLPRGVPLFESMIAFENVPGGGAPAAAAGGADAGELRWGAGRYHFRTNYPLNLMVVPGGEMLLRANYSADRFDGASVRRLLRSLRATLLALAASPGRTLASIPVVDAEGHAEAMRAWDREPAPYPDAACIHELFEAHARARPDAVAVEADGLALTYGELDRRATRLAARLRAEGVGPETLVGVFAERSAALVVGVLGVLKAGGAYVPLDPAYPPLRLARMLEAAQSPVVLCPAALRDRLPPFDGRVIDPEADDDAAPGDVGGLAPAPENTAYVIFTSGSTGQPKGILLAHRGLCAMLPDWNRRFGVRAGSRVLQFASFSFDAATWEIFSALIAGATLCFGSRQTVFAPDALAEMLRGQRITHALLPPSLLAACGPASAPELEAVAAIGERCTAAVARAWAPGRIFVNAYGPAEATITNALHQVGEDDAGDPPIGRALRNVRLYSLDAHGHPAPPGVAGELYVGGVLVARGYLGRPGATAERFLPDPFGGEPGERMYRTGDRVRMREDGALEYLGRGDQQVKVRGVRIEPAEVEVALAGHPAIAQAAVVPRAGQGGDTRLAAYLVPRNGTPALAELRGWVRRSLPESMVPAAWVFMDALPLSPNGKVDRGALPEPPAVRPDEAGDYVAPRTPAEAMLAELAAELLGVDRVGAADNFFALGGDSILGMRLIARARRGGMMLTPRQLFEAETLADLAAAAGETAAAPAQDDGAGPIPLAPLHRWFLEGEPGDAGHFTQAIVAAASVPLEADAVRRAVQALVDAHASLRLRVERDGEGWTARIAAPGVPVALDVLPPAESEADVLLAAERCRAPFDLGAGPLLRAALLPGGAAGADRLVLAAHHLAVDAVSWGILLDDLESALRQALDGRPAALPAAPSVAAWARWQQELARAPGTEAELAHWRGAVAGIDWLPRELDGDNTVDSADVVEVGLGADEAAALPRGGAAGEGAEDRLLAALFHALRRWTGRGRVVVALEGHGRGAGEDGPDTGRMTGWLTAMAPLAIEAPADADAEGAALVAAVRRARRARPGGGRGYGLLRHLRADLAAADVLRRAGDPPLSFNYLGRLDTLLPPGALLRVAPDETGTGRSPRARRPFLVEVDAWSDAGGVHARWTFSRAVHRRATIERVAADFREALRGLLAEGAEEGTETEHAPRFAAAALGDDDLARALAQIQAQLAPAAAHTDGSEP